MLAGKLKTRVFILLEDEVIKILYKQSYSEEFGAIQSSEAETVEFRTLWGEGTNRVK